MKQAAEKDNRPQYSRAFRSVPASSQLGRILDKCPPNPSGSAYGYRLPVASPSFPGDIAFTDMTCEPKPGWHVILWTHGGRRASLVRLVTAVPPIDECDNAIPLITFTSEDQHQVHSLQMSEVDALHSVIGYERISDE